MGKRVLIGTICLLGGAAVLVAFTIKTPHEQAPVGANIEFSLIEAEKREPVPAGYKKYIDEKYRFSLLYPEKLGQQMIDEREDSLTIVFQNPSEGKGFQIFITPFQEKEITEERFRKDRPSGVRENVEEVMVDGATGIAFYSKDAALGETREVWLVNNGYLFEVTTLKILEADLLKVLSTWKFM